MKLILSILLFAAQSFAAADKVQIVLNWKPEPEFGAFYSAQVNGFYKKHNLDVELTPGGAGTPSVQMVASKKIDFGISNADEVIISQTHGAKVMGVFANYQNTPYAIMTHAEQNFTSLEDVYNSKTVLAIESGLPYAQYLKSKFPKATAQVVPYLGGIGNFIGDKNFAQQCFFTSEPLIAEKKGLKVKTFLVGEAGFNPYTTILITREDVIKKNPDLVKRVVEATREGLKAYLENPDAVNAEMNKLNSAMDLETFKAGANMQKALIETKDTQKSGLGTMSLERWKQLIDQLADLKLIAKKPEAKAMFQNF